MKHILVPTDFSNVAGKASELAIEIAFKFDAEILFAHGYLVNYASGGRGAMKNLDHLIRKDAQKKLEKFEKEIKEKHPTLKFKTLNDASLPEDTIQELCEEKDFDLVVMGTSGASGVKDKFIGSTTSHMIGKAGVPLLAVPGNTKTSLPSKILVATDFKSDKYVEELTPLVEISRGLGCKVDFINIQNASTVDVTITDLPKVKNLLGANFGEMHIIESENIEDALASFIEENHIEILTVVAHQKTFWEKLWNKSVTRSLVKHASIPVLVLPEK